MSVFVPVASETVWKGPRGLGLLKHTNAAGDKAYVLNVCHCWDRRQQCYVASHPDEMLH